ncbi:hypothetical protein K0M31_018904 [Melipona bicolor]|uniref:Ion transport N-terminal domain-containing protein n=1 Tax=Melipona bicolor TaxID=60889 RepID=A0AA40KS55_9HYME|nr:hypothetical protein K0M31_018904 [Melipona bicolor]
MADDHDATRGSREIHEQRTPLLIKETRLGDKGLSSVLVSSWPALSLHARATSKFGESCNPGIPKGSRINLSPRRLGATLGLLDTGNEMNYKGSGKVHFGVDDVSLYGTPKEEPGPGLPGQEVKQSFLKNQLQALFQPTDNKLAMKLFGSKKALMKERIRQKAAGHWVIHPCSSFRETREIPLSYWSNLGKDYFCHYHCFWGILGSSRDFVASGLEHIHTLNSLELPKWSK